MKRLMAIVAVLLTAVAGAIWASEAILPRVDLSFVGQNYAWTNGTDVAAARAIASITVSTAIGSFVPTTNVVVRLQNPHESFILFQTACTNNAAFRDMCTEVIEAGGIVSVTVPCSNTQTNQMRIVFKDI